MRHHTGVTSRRLRTQASLWQRVCVVVPLLLLAGCDTPDAGDANIDANGESTLSFTPPLALQVSRQIDPAQLALTVRVDGRQVAVPQVSDDRWQGSTTVQTGRLVTVSVVWTYQGLVVAQAIREVPVPRAGTTNGNPQLAFDSNEFDTTADFDNDGRSNLREYDENSDPRSSVNPGTPLGDVPLSVSFLLPDELQSAAQDITDPVQINASINNDIISLTRNDNVWRGRTTVRDGSDVFVRASVFATTDQTNELARLQRGARVNQDTELVFDGGDFRTTFDSDLNGQTNLNELLAGSEPVSVTPEPTTTEPATPAAPTPTPAPTPSEPAPPLVLPPAVEPEEPVDPDAQSDDGCALSAFDSACSIDTDEDGIPDSEETELADTDDDGIPDYLDSAVDDADADGISAQLDVNEDDPCSPDTRADACVLQFLDTDGDNILDVDEGDEDSDGDGKPDNVESFIDDADDDGIVDQLDAD